MAGASAARFPLGSAAAVVKGIRIMAKNYYAILGVLPTATSEDIGGAYYRFQIFDRLWSNFTPTAPYKSERLQNLCLEIILSLDEARRGGHMEIMLPSQTLCPTCKGKGGVGPY
jgi:DnaJ-class molecular chaperone